MDEIRDEQAGRKSGTVCLLCRLLAEWPEQDAADLREALEDKNVFTTTIVAVLVARGADATDNKVGHHRRNHRMGKA